MWIAVTGATGYIGTCLTYLALKRGHDVSAVSRRKPISHASAWIPFNLLSEKTVVLPTEVTAIVHLAANTAEGNDFGEEQEVRAARILIKAAQNTGAKFIFVSSQTAHPDAPTAYGRIKWRIEREVLSAGGWVVRPGQVYGGDRRGLFGIMVMAIQFLPILPMFVPAPRVQPIHVGDLAEGLLRIAERRDALPGVYCLAAPEPVAFLKFLDEIAKSRLRCLRLFVPVPIIVINALAPVLGKSLQTRLGLDRLRSLFKLPVMETASDLKQLGLTLRPLRSGMHPSGDDRRRRLLREGRILLAYVLKELPTSIVLRRYIRAIEHLRGGRPMELPRFFLGNPLWLSLLDETAWANKAAGAEFSWRLDAATVLAETSPSGACHFLGLGCAHGVWSSLLSIVSAVACEGCWRMARALLFPVVRFALRR